jgi:hypothetical protein
MNEYTSILITRLLSSEIAYVISPIFCHRSSYFRNIEDDVHKHAASIMEVKSCLESFETQDMEKLIRFHQSIEMVLEQLTDESQVIKGILVVKGNHNSMHVLSCYSYNHLTNLHSSLIIFMIHGEMKS